MRTNLSILVLGSIALSLLVVQMSGIGGVMGVGDPGDSEYQVDDRVKDLGEQEPSVSGSAIGEDPSALQFMVSSGQTVMSWVVAVFMLPATLNHWLPWYAAYPFGLGLQSLAIFGIAQYFGGTFR